MTQSKDKLRFCSNHCNHAWLLLTSVNQALDYQVSPIGKTYRVAVEITIYDVSGRDKKLARDLSRARTSKHV
jgi:hypothetical protein